MIRIGVFRPHVVRIRQAEIVIEPMASGQELRVISQMPLPIDGCCVVTLLEEFRNRHLVFMDAYLALRPESAPDADPIWIAAGEKGGARSGADRLGRMEVGEPNPLFRETVQIRGLKPFRAETSHIRIALVVGEDDDDVGEFGWRTGPLAPAAVHL